MTPKIWSLLKIMVKFDAWGIATVLHQIEELRDLSIKLSQFGERDKKVPADIITDRVFPVIMIARHHAIHAHLESTSDRVWDNGPFSMASKTGMTWQELQNELNFLRQCIEADLEKRSFVLIQPPKDHAFLSIKAEWGMVWERFKGARYDSEQAVGCYALDFYTACIFHLMRVAELGLRGLARRMKVKLPKKKKLEWAQWQEILKVMNDNTAKISIEMKAGPRKDELLEFYRGCLGSFYGFKDEYRNQTMHPRKQYDQFGAERALVQVKDFMNKLALRIDEDGKRLSLPNKFTPP